MCQSDSCTCNPLVALLVSSEQLSESLKQTNKTNYKLFALFVSQPEKLKI